MRKKTRFCAFLAALTMGLGILSGCTGAPASSAPAQAASVSAPASGAQAGKPDTSEAVTLTMYLIGDRPVDNDEVFAKINEKLKAEINATIDVKFMSWGEYEQKYPLIFASGEDWDIIYTADWCFYNAQATKQLSLIHICPASDKPVLPDGAVVIKKIEHAQARLCRRRDHRRMHGAADGKLRLVRTHCNGERAGIFLGRFIRGSLCTEIKRKPCSVRRFRFRQRLQRVKDLEGGFARDEFPAAFVVGRRHQRGRGVFVYAYREQTVQPHRRPAAAVPAEHGGKRSGEYAAQKLGAVVAAARQMQADAGQRAVRGIGIQPFGIAENGKMHVPTPPAVVLPAQWPGYKL